ncbi:MAG: D-lyxose/D-mannose family sugar isomerase [Anaerolineae bacterium]|nr:D-lyxose/D-mannose family sugar isomerase [Anaerolineae bacterium]
MKRSEINQIILLSAEFIASHGFILPPFADWSLEDWSQKGSEVREIVENSLGWDITDFGSGDFKTTGLFLFTLRNGRPDRPQGKPYAEKIMISLLNQVTPMHFHWHKSEDIINRGGGKLAVKLYCATKDENLDLLNEVQVFMDGVFYRLEPGTIVYLNPGESITLRPYLYHSFWAADQPVLLGEVSSVNDDTSDNRFLEPVGRFPDIVEDENPVHLLVGDYARYYQI